MECLKKFLLLCMLVSFLSSCSEDHEQVIQLNAGDRIAFIGSNLCSRMINYNHFESEIYSRFSDSLVYVRNMCDGGNRPGFRPHSGRNEPWEFPGAEKFYDEFAAKPSSVGHLETEGEWLDRHNINVVLAFFGTAEALDKQETNDLLREEYKAFIKHSLEQKYHPDKETQLVLIGPTSIENLGSSSALPNGTDLNERLSAITALQESVASEMNVPFVNLFDVSKKWFAGGSDLTVDGLQLNDDGYKKLASYLGDVILGGSSVSISNDLKAAIDEKNWYWHNDYKMPNGVHAFGRRYDPFGPDNYPDEFKKLRELTANRDTLVWEAAKGLSYNLAEADSHTTELKEVESNYEPGAYGRGGKYLYGDDALNSLTLPEGYKVEMFASEEDFPDLANPVQLSFDNQGRLWVACMPTYPHWKPGDSKPDDKLIILEDTNNDGKADSQKVWADGLHIPVGFEFAPEGVYVSQGTNLILLTDTDGDDKADKKEIIYSGFDDHDTHHVISAFCADPSGALYMGEGVFLHTNVETPYGMVRGTNGGFYRFQPQRRHLERTAQLSIPNPWGIAFDEWGQPIFAETSGPAVRWMLPGTVKSRYGVATHKSKDLIPEENKVRPTSGLEFVSSRHFPDEVQGDLILANSIGFLGMRQHIMKDDGAGFSTDLRHDIIKSTDGNFRPVDMEFAPDGSLYLVDWHNVLIGHMQHNARDPYRDHVHGRIYRITYPSRPLVDAPEIVDASIDELLENLKLPEYRARYRTKRELRGRDSGKVISALETWLEDLDVDSDNYERHLMEAMWVYWGLNEKNDSLLDNMMNAEDYRVRAAAVRFVRYNGHLLEDQVAMLNRAAEDDHGRVRLEAITAASWLDKDSAMEILATAGKYPLDDWLVHAHQTAVAHVNGVRLEPVKKTDKKAPTDLTKAQLELYHKGEEIYLQDGYCGTCHQENGKGLAATGYPPLVGTRWVLENPERLVKLTLKGLYGPIRVKSVDYPGTVPMTPYEGLLDDEEIASVLTYVRNSFGNKASAIKPEFVAKVRKSVLDKKGFYDPKDLLAEHPN